jgi:DNA replication and repair protein RecF
VRLLGINLENFRNLDSLSLEFGSDRIFFLGANGQGKTNLLEAIGICSNLRSFRGSSPESMVMDGKTQSRIFAKFLDDDGQLVEVMINFGRKGGKEVEIDGESVKKLGDLLGKFPMVCLSSRDFRLVREGPSDRRKWMDLILSSTNSNYLSALQNYYRSMRERNALLKKQSGDSEILAFEYTLAASAQFLHLQRSQLFPSLNQSYDHAYSTLSGQQESASLSYSPDCSFSEVDDWLKMYSEERQRDRLLGSTRRGPHRDDFSLLLDKRDARHFASEGQQKGVVLALRVAEFSFLREKNRTMPILLADDVLGELDSFRRSNFRKLLHPSAQTFATGTSYPSLKEVETWETFRVKSARFSPQDQGEVNG